jgi:hypothetical protein
MTSLTVFDRVALTDKSYRFQQSCFTEKIMMVSSALTPLTEKDTAFMPKRSKPISAEDAFKVLSTQMRILIQMLFNSGLAPGLEGYTQEAISITAVLRDPEGDLLAHSLLAVPKAQEDTIQSLVTNMQATIDKARAGAGRKLN